MGPPREVIDMYLSQASGPQYIGSDGSFELSKRENPYTLNQLIVRRVRLEDTRGQTRSTFKMGDAMNIVISVHRFSEYRDCVLGVIFKSTDGQIISGINTAMVKPSIEGTRQIDELVSLRIPRLPFMPGSYSLAISITRGPIGLQERMDYIDRAAQFDVEDSDVYGTGYRVTGSYGIVYLEANWEIGKGFKTGAAL